MNDNVFIDNVALIVRLDLAISMPRIIPRSLHVVQLDLTALLANHIFSFDLQRYKTKCLADKPMLMEV